MILPFSTNSPLKETKMNKEKIFLAGHNGMVGQAIRKLLQENKKVDLITIDRSEIDLLDQRAVHDFLHAQKPDTIILAAAKVGGIHANKTYPAEFIYENLQIQNNIVNGAHLADVNKLLFLGSSCIYPKFATYPITEKTLLTGELEPTNEPYAIAKIAGIKLCESYNRQYNRDYRSVMPTNLYGPGDNYHPENSHVIPGLIRRIHRAKIDNAEQVVIWGSGTPMREFMYVEDMASACVFFMNLKPVNLVKVLGDRVSHINIGTGRDISIKELALEICATIGFKGSLKFDTSKPDGTPRKLLDVSKLRSAGWAPKFTLKEGLKISYQHYINNYHV
jgi:GDP-L-fucose synthase